MVFDEVDSADIRNPFNDVSQEHAKNMKSIRERVHRAASVTGSLVGLRPHNEGDMQFEDNEEDKVQFYDNSALLKTPEPKIKKSLPEDTDKKMTPTSSQERLTELEDSPYGR